MRNPERFTPVEWDGGASQSFRVQIAVTSWDRPRLLEDVARTFAEYGANIVEYGGHVDDQMAKNWYVAEVGDVTSLRGLLTALRNVEGVFDAYRVTSELMDQLAVLHELEEADQELSADACERSTSSRARCRRSARGRPMLSERLARLPAERAAVATARADAERDIEARRKEHEEVLAAGYRDEAEARREQTRAADLLHSAERRLEAATAEEARLAEEEETAAREARELGERAVGLEADPPAGDSLDELAAWATETRAALFVRRAQVAAQREAAIRQANELGSALLGESLVAQSAALVARRVEEARR